MNRSSIVRMVLILAFVLFGNTIFGVLSQFEEASSDGRSIRWERFDVTIDNIDTAANRFDVVEHYELAITRGPYTFGFAEIPTGRLDEIAAVTIYENGAPLRQSCGGSPGTYCVTNEGDLLAIDYYFSRTAQTGDRRSIDVAYTVSGALRSYDEGDELFWVAVPEDLAFPPQASRVTVQLPAGADPLAVTSYPDDWEQSVNGTTITWTGPPDLADDLPFEARVKYPHDPAMDAPGWQWRYDLEQRYIDNVQPIASLVMVALALALGVGGSLFVVTRYLNHGRDPATVVVPEYLTEPPTDERPGVVGLLLDEKADMKDIMATLVDLARRGHFDIEQDQTSTLGFMKKSSFTFHRADEPPTESLRGFEQTLLRGLFPGGRSQTDLDDLKTKFYKFIPGIKEQMYSDLVGADYFTRSPERTRNIWIGVGIGGLIVASLLFWAGWSVAFLQMISPLIMLPPVGLGIVGAVALLFADAMPAKTDKGAQDAALWRAFRRYLGNLEQHGDTGPAAEHFDRYLAYAVAFGIEGEFVRRVTPALTSMPPWYHPTYLGGPWRGGYHRRRRMGGPVVMGPAGRPTGRGDAGGDFSLGGPGGLGDLDQSLGEGLSAMNQGLTQMLNDASRAMTTRPQSSSSGGGFSGGGAGGGSGGGSRGFG